MQEIQKRDEEKREAESTEKFLDALLREGKRALGRGEMPDSGCCLGLEVLSSPWESASRS